jgi:hypothetical protein
MYPGNVKADTDKPTMTQSVTNVSIRQAIELVLCCRYVYMETLKKLGWKKVGALTEDGQKYSDYISAMQAREISICSTFAHQRRSCTV